MKKVTAFCLDWHVKQSDAFIDMLVEPLKSYLNIKLTAWDGEMVPKNNLDDRLAIFCMLPPSDSFLKYYKGRIIWLPMWDQAQGYDQDWWDNLPKSVHIVAFSDVINEKSTRAGLPTLKLKYFKDPAVFTPVQWDNGYTVFYWNRTGLVGPDFIKKLCSSIDAKKMIFLSDIDPRILEEKRYDLPAKISNTEVSELKHSSRAKYLAAVDEANIFIAPRASEGVGMTFLEAIAKGAAVIAYDAPTMNEYIRDGKNGLLLRNKVLGLSDKILHKPVADIPSGEVYYLRSVQDWEKISRTDFRKLGDKARQDHIEGFSDWQSNISRYAQFILGGN